MAEAVPLFAVIAYFDKP
ncbi:hypothetical protein ES1_25450 [[Eubacterium] siraeum V10Sc8a]|uniref:Uncharacterized protein n=1 Tax=[Eubacterium] siraeum V10Sc8a TaxID=717961 RepID=D4MNK6_9FIRM|nr:hypothetical protein ES1_25450 [[Eubacterium] siraeum V10Sc8a]